MYVGINILHSSAGKRSYADPLSQQAFDISLSASIGVDVIHRAWHELRTSTESHPAATLQTQRNGIAKLPSGNLT